MDQDYVRLARRIEALELGKSYYAPVSGESSLGTPHPDAALGVDMIHIYSGTPATQTARTAIDLSPYVSAGTKAAFIYGKVRSANNAAFGLWIASGDDWHRDTGYVEAQGYGGASYQTFPFSALVRLDAALKFYINRSNANLYDCDIWLGFHWE